MKKTKILLGVVGFLMMVIVLFVVAIGRDMAMVGVAPDPTFLKKSIFQNPLTKADMPNNTMHSDIIQYQCQRMPNGQRVFDCQMTIFMTEKQVQIKSSLINSRLNQVAIFGASVGDC